jgi:hypothetical protein
MVTLLLPLNVRAQPLLLLLQLLFLPSDPFITHWQDHHYRLVARLLAIRRAARSLLLLLSFQRNQPFLYPRDLALSIRSDPILVVSLGLLARAENITLRDDQG